MSVLACACVLIGVFPRAVIQLPIKAADALGFGFDPGAFSPILEMTRNITLAAAVFFVVLLVICGIRLVLYRGKTIAKSGTWGCGFTQPTVKMQYTGSSYASFILEFFKPAAPLTEDHPAISGRFPLKTHYRSHINDIAELHLNRVIVNPILFLFDKLRWIQHGDIHLYIGYILLAIVLLLFFI
jgi:hydrogenase-4 component B